MSSEIADVAERFTSLVLRYKDWKGVEVLSADEIQILFDVVQAAGFEPGGLVHGRLDVPRLNERGGAEDKTHLTNYCCPYFVVNKEGHNDSIATGWLNALFLRVIQLRESNDDTFNQLVSEVLEKLDRSRPLEPMQLTPEGDYLLELNPYTGYDGCFPKHTRDETELGTEPDVFNYVGKHRWCNRTLARMRATEYDDVIVCDACCLRVRFPKEVKTYGELRRVLSERFAKVEA